MDIKSSPAGCLIPVPSSATQCSQLMHVDGIWPMSHVACRSYRRIPTGWDSKQCRKACFRPDVLCNVCLWLWPVSPHITEYVCIYAHLYACMPVVCISLSVCLSPCLFVICLSPGMYAMCCHMDAEVLHSITTSCHVSCRASACPSRDTVKSEKHQELSQHILTSMCISYPTCRQDILEPPLDAVALTSSVGKQVESVHEARQM
jgi:hypothetical protein